MTVAKYRSDRLAGGRGRPPLPLRSTECKYGRSRLAHRSFLPSPTGGRGRPPLPRSTECKYGRSRLARWGSLPLPTCHRGLADGRIEKTREVSLGFLVISRSLNYLMMVETTPEPTVLPPSRIAKRSPCSSAMGAISLTVMVTWSPGITISTPAGRSIVPVTSVVLK